jgi:hypothetical protein
MYTQLHDVMVRGTLIETFVLALRLRATLLTYLSFLQVMGPAAL